MSDLVALRQQGKIGLGPDVGCLPALVRHATTKLEKKDGPRVVVDLDDTVVMWYLPDLIGTGLRVSCDASHAAIVTLLTVYTDGTPPGYQKDVGWISSPLDKEVKDRRAQQPTIPKDNPVGRSENGPLTRSRTLADAPHLNSAWGNHPKALMPSTRVRRGEDLSEDPAVAPYPLRSWEFLPDVETDDEVRWTGGIPQTRSLGTQSENQPVFAAASPVEPLSTVPSLAYYFSLKAEFQPDPPDCNVISFRDALAPHCGRQTVAFLEAKRLFDGQLSYLTDIIHFQLAESMRKNGWTSAFPCYGVAGIRAGIDIIGVAGDVHRGWDLCLPDIKLEVEWGPGSVGAFDGYDLRHYVKPWKGGARVALISFCRRSTWSGLGLDCSLRRPTLSEIHLPVPLNHINGTLRDLGRVFDGSLLGPDYRMQAGEPKESNSR
ncbi:hypothetical protein RhiJN_13130 [Ceratobasidium sp. AG-Ba]|nr:hypothetical protein RhiJN_13130 [Ceratobasidium sp. AG-Ba]QRW13695.1 hypothetical protein RhiLY_12694 [Ceratobasidium sp. AG-Ba]